MPVSSYVRGAEAWTPVGHKSTRDDGRCLPVGPLHALEPASEAAVCAAPEIRPDPGSATFEPWAPGTCEACSASLDPRTDDPHDPSGGALA